MYLTIAIRTRGVPLPQEDAVDVRHRMLGQEGLDLAIVVGKDHHGNVEARRLDFMGQCGGVHVPTWRLVTMRLKRGWVRASSSASAPFETCVMPGGCCR